jgi:hypothetical protein
LFSFTQPFTRSIFCLPNPFLFGATPAINIDRSLSALHIWTKLRFYHFNCLRYGIQYKYIMLRCSVYNFPTTKPLIFRSPQSFPLISTTSSPRESLRRRELSDYHNL